MKKLLIILIPLLFSCVKKEGIPLFKASDTALKGVGNSISVEIDSSSVSTLLAEQPDSIRLSIPAKDGTIWVNVSKNNIFGDGFTVMSDSTTEAYETNDVFYGGKVEDEENSLVAINIVSGEITGFISSLKYGELSIGKTNEVSTTSYMVHENTSDTLVFNCLEIDPPNLKELQQLKKTEVSIQADVPRCVTKDFELTYEVFQKYGSVTAATNWILNLFAGEKAIYKNEGIELVLGLVYVWTTPDGYNSNAATALQQFGDKRRNDPAFKGNIAQLIRGRDGGALSGIAYVDILCNREYRFSYAEPMWTYAAYPSYSWSVEVITHEDGHNIACPHTHNCNWELSPGVFGAIDNCYTTEGGCPASLPCAGCGTIMSYCHLNSAVGIQFRNGFGPIPGNRLRSRVNSGSCAVCGTITPPQPPDPPVVPPVEPPTDEKLISKGKPAALSTSSFYGAQYVNDGIITNFAHSLREANPWISIDLQSSYDVSKIEIYNRVNCSQCVGRLKSFRVFVSNSPDKTWNSGDVVYEYNAEVKDGQKFVVPVSKNGRYVTFMANNTPANYLHLAEISVYSGKASVPPPVVPCRDSVIHNYPYTAYKDTTVRVCN